ncbi:SAM-dependent DNA methyltransferase [Methylobacterium sp. D54C]
MDSLPPPDLIDGPDALPASMPSHLSRKASGAYFTPEAVAATLVRWSVRGRSDRLLDPSCGDGMFVAAHSRSFGIEMDPASAAAARRRAPAGEIHVGDFFTWAERTGERFDCAAGNPPFVRYQLFAGETRARALRLCLGLGVRFSGLTSSWAPFLVATAALLKAGGRMAFVVPAEIGHAPYAAPVLEFAVANFSVVHVVAIREKLFPDLSEDCWLLFADGFGGSTGEIRFSAAQRFAPSDEPPTEFERVDVSEWRQAWRRRLRPYLAPRTARDAYLRVAASAETSRLGEIAAVGIGYVTGANGFFHLRPSQAARLGIPDAFLQPTVRNGRVLGAPVLGPADVARWRERDEPYLLLRLPTTGILPEAVRAYLDGADGLNARTSYKCRVRTPWYAVPDVRIPDYLLSYMSGERPALVRNDARCSATNSVHCVRVINPSLAHRLSAWGGTLADLSCEVEGHPLGGGLLKLEPREAARVLLPAPGQVSAADGEAFREALAAMRIWRHRAA